MFHRILVSIAALALSMSAVHAQAYDEDDTITVIINLSAGGSTGVMAQLFSRYWSEHIPGNPQFVVQPVTGGAQLRGMIQARDARPDGLTLGWVSWGAATRQVGPASQQVDWSQFDIIAGMGAQSMAYMRSDVAPGITKPEDIANAKGIQIGGYRPGSHLDLIARLTLDILGLDYGYTTGFGGGAKIVAAMQRDEINFHAVPAANYFSGIEENIVKAGIGLPLWYYATTGEDGEMVTREDTFGDIRPFHAVYESITGAPPDGALWETLKWLNDGTAGVTWLIAAPKGVEEERLEILRKGFMAAAQDPDYLKEVERITGLVPDVSGPKAMQQVIASLSGVSPQIVETLQEYIKSGSR